jgi:hypothetical protein
MSFDRDPQGRFIADKPATQRNKPETTLGKARRILEQQLDSLTVRPGDTSPAELASVVKTLISINELEPANPTTKEDGDRSALIDEMTDEERELLSQHFDRTDVLLNTVRARLGRPLVPRHFNRASISPLEFLLTLIGRRDEGFLQLLKEFVSDNGVQDKFDIFEEDAHRQVFTQLHAWLRREGIYESFAAKVEAKMLERAGA